MTTFGRRQRLSRWQCDRERTSALKKLHGSHAQQVPKPPAPEPEPAPGKQPPDIPVPDPTPPPIENPGDLPLPPITDPDVVTPSDPVPANPPVRADGSRNNIAGLNLRGTDLEDVLSNLLSSSALEHAVMEPHPVAVTNSSATAQTAAIPGAAAQPSDNWRIEMPSIKPVEDASQDFGADLAALRDDVTKLSSSVSAFIRAQTASTTDTVLDAVDNARQKISDTASKAQDRVAGASSDLETTIERNPLVAVLVAMIVGVLVGMLSRSRK